MKRFFYKMEHRGRLDVHLLYILQGFAEILDGIVTIGSLGFFASRFEMDVACFRAKYALRLLKKSREM